MSKLETYLKNLEKEDAEIVKDTISDLIKTKKFEKELIEIVKNFKTYTNFVPVWTAIILGERKSAKAIEPIVNLFNHTTQDDVLPIQAALFSLKKIAAKHPKKIYPALKNYIDSKVELLRKTQKEKDWEKINKQGQNRIYAYSILGDLAPNEEVKKYLLTKLSEDPTMSQYFIYSLLKWPLDKGMEAIFKREAELALLGQGGSGYMNRAYIEAKWALIDYKKGFYGDKYKSEQKEEDQTWEKKWDFIFKEWAGKDKKEEKKSAEKSPEEEKKISKKEIERQKKIQKEQKTFYSTALPKFNLDNFLKNRVQNNIEKGFQALMDESKLKVKVEEIQKKLNEKDIYSVEKVAQDLIKKTNVQNDKKQAERLTNATYNLWYITPREEYSGISPAEKENFEKYFGKIKVNRNDPCPCGEINEDGTPKKFKKCCAKRFEQKNI